MTAPAIKENNRRESMNIVIVGHVDHGKSTIIGRLLTDTNSLPEGKLKFVKETCRRNARPFEYAFLLDALKDEQAQGITIDSSRCFFKTAKRNYILIDAPGHIEFLKNMITGASRAEAALLVIGADEGVRENSRRHGYMLSLLGIKQVAVLINKMDLVGYSRETYEEIKTEFSAFLHKAGIHASAFIPVSGREGDNISAHSSRMLWYQSHTVLSILDTFAGGKQPEDKPFRMPVQAVYKFTGDGDSRRIIAGTVVSGTLNAGDKVLFSPSGKTGTVKTIETFQEAQKTSVGAGYATGFTLTDQVYVTRGELASRSNEPNPLITSCLKVKLFWLGREPMQKDRQYLLKLGTAKVTACLDRIIRVMDASTLEYREKDSINKNEVAECILQLTRDIACDSAEDLIHTGRFAIVDQYEISGGGIIEEALQNGCQTQQEKEQNWYLTSNSGPAAHQERSGCCGQQGITVWFTGLSGAGKTTVAETIKAILTKEGCRVDRLDGDIVREYFTRDLGYSRKDRDENIRRSSYAASLLTRNGVITLCSFISPYRKAREEARKLIGNFIEVYVNAPLEVCRARDVKGLYARAESGEIAKLTGIADPYEPPKNPEIELRTDRETIEESALKVISYLKTNGYIWSGYADLHLHTTASDGTFEPGLAVKNAKAAGLTAIAITDHDTVSGLKDAVRAGAKLGMEVIPGIELSALDGEKEIHILGYFIDPANPQLTDLIAKLEQSRENRAIEMVKKLNGIGVDISIDRVKELAGGDVIGRPHIARAMQEKGMIHEIKEAFSSEYIGRSGKAYVERYELTPKAAIRIIQEAGGIAVLAHPGYLSDRSSILEETIQKYIPCGLQGIEVYYSCHTLSQINTYLDIAHKYNLLITGGSDNHGAQAPMLGCVRLPYNYLKALQKAKCQTASAAASCSRAAEPRPLREED
jgi:bifunctional enzyme CysN/CysC